MFYIVLGAFGQSDSMIATAESERLAERNSFFSLSFNPGIDIPLGSSADNFDFGATGRIAANGGGGIYLDFSPRLSLKAAVSGGYYYGFFNDPAD
jgi:hypothetical protein